jgi:hypothetical protein
VGHHQIENKKNNRENHTMQHVTYITFERGRGGRDIVFTMLWGVCGYVEVTWTPMLFVASVVVTSVNMTTCVSKVSSDDVCGRGREKKVLASSFLVCIICPM